MSHDDQAIADHVRGAIVKANTPFSGLPVPEPADWDQAFCDRWVMPFYGASFSHRFRTSELRESFARACVEASPAVIDQLLRSSGWRERGVGAWMAAVQRSEAFHDLVVPLLLRSEVCFAGKAYVLVLVRSGSGDSIDALERYCGYYLTRPDLDFDQSQAFAGLIELVGLDSDRVQRLMPLWESWCEPNRYRTLERAQTGLRADLERLAEIDALCAGVREQLDNHG